MLDLDRLRINVTSGRYVVDEHAVADALLSHAGIAPPPATGAARPYERRNPFSRAGAGSRTDRPPPRRRD